MARIDYIANTVSRPKRYYIFEKAIQIKPISHGFPREYIDSCEQKPLTAIEIARRGAEVCFGVCQPHRKHVDSRIVEPKKLT